MTYEEAKKLREAFQKIHKAGFDDAKAPDFFSEIARKTVTPEQCKIAFIVVAHLVHSLPYFIEALSQLGEITTIIPKSSHYVSSVDHSIRQNYKDYISADINKAVLKEDGETTRKFLLDILSKWPEHQFMIIDHGGYFAHQLQLLRDVDVPNRFLGIVEHTLNGQQKYEAYKSPTTPLFPVPVYSIAQLPLKAYEDNEVGSSILRAIQLKICSGEGFNQDLSRMGTISVIGYGHMGEAIALQLKKELGINSHIMIADTDPEKLAQADRSYFDCVNEPELLTKSDLIIVATSRPAFTEVNLSQLKQNTCIVCVTSSDDLITEQALESYTVTQSPDTLLTKYEHKETKHSFYLIGDGCSLNFSIGSTAHPIIHLVLAAVCRSAQELIQGHQTPCDRIQTINSEAQQAIQSVWESYYGSINFYEFITVIKNYYASQLTIPLLFGKQTCRQFSDLFTPLEIVEKFKESEPHQKKQKPISPNDIFTKNDSESIKNQLILGAPGYGKTTLVKKIIADYLKGADSLKPFNSVIWIPLRRLNCDEIQSIKNLAGLLYFLYKDFIIALKWTPEKLMSTLLNFLQKPGELLFLLDGWDELQPQARLPIFQDLYACESYYVLITSRPHIQPENFPANRVMIIAGFNAVEINTYVTRYFAGTGKESNQLIAHLKSDLLLSLAKSPMLLMLLCAFWDVGKFRPEFVEFTSATIIYDQMKTLLVERYLEEKQPVEQKGLLLSDIDFPAALHRSLYYIAYQVQSVGKQDMSYGQIVHWVQELVNTKFPKSKADKLKAKIMHVIFSFDFIKLIEINDDRNQNRYEMLHLSMQEFLTACYLQDNFDDKAQDFLRKNRYNQQQLNVWGFTAGLMRDNEQELKQFFEILFEEPRDLIGAREIPIVMNCLIECLPEDITKKLPYWFEEIIESIISIIMEQKKSSKFHFDLGWGPSNNMPNLLSATRYLPNYIRQKLMSCDTKIDEASRLQTYNSNQIDKNKECAIKFGGSSSTQFQHDDQWDKTYELVLLEINKHKSAEFNWEKDRRRITSEMASAFELLYKRAMRSSSMPMLHSFICYHDHFFNTTIIEELQELAIHANDLDKSNKLLGLANLNSICCHSMYYLKFLILTNMMRTLIIYLSAPFMRLSNSYLIPDCDMGFLVKKINDLINGNSLLKKQGIAALIAAQEVQPIVKSTIGNCNLFHCLYGIRQHDLSTFINRLDYSYFLNQYNLNWEFITLFSNTSLQEIVTTISQTKLNSNKYEFLSLSLAYLICLKNIAVVLNDNIMNFFGESENNTFSTPITEIDIMKIAGFSTEYFGYRPIKYLAPNSSQNFSYRIFQEPKAEHSGEAELPLLGWTRFIP